MKMNNENDVQRFQIRLADPRQLQKLLAYLDAEWEHRSSCFSRTIDNTGACGDPAVVTVELGLPVAQRDEFIEAIRQRFRVEITGNLA